MYAVAPVIRYTVGISFNVAGVRVRSCFTLRAISSSSSTPCPEKMRPVAFLQQVLHFLIDFHSFAIDENRNEYSMTTSNLLIY